jgi:hypothetical protein
VYDQGQAPLKGATVSVANSQFTATTDDSGRYALDYVPGAFTVLFFHEGYVSDSLSISVAKKTNYPARDAVLWRIPESGSMYAIAPGATIQIPACQVDERAVPMGDFYGTTKIDVRLTGTPVAIPTSKFSIVSSLRGNVRFVRLGDDLAIGTRYRSLLTNRMADWQNLDVEFTPIAENVYRSTYDLTPGTYALVEVESNMMGQVMQVTRGYAFKVS